LRAYADRSQLWANFRHAERQADGVEVFPSTHETMVT
jgi:hypothetical protein